MSPERGHDEVARSASDHRRLSAYRRRLPELTPATALDAPKIERTTLSTFPVAPSRVHIDGGFIPRTVSAAQAGLTALATAGSSFVTQVLALLWQIWIDGTGEEPFTMRAVRAV